jgi:hypothetical protein
MKIYPKRGDSDTLFNPVGVGGFGAVGFSGVRFAHPELFGFDPGGSFAIRRIESE